MGLGSLSEMSLKEARRAADEQSAVVRRGKDPVKERQRLKREATKALHLLADVARDAFESRKAELKGEEMYHFLGKLVDVVLPRIKDWPGIKGSSGDSSGNISFGLVSENVAMFPEIEVNYDM